MSAAACCQQTCHECAEARAGCGRAAPTTAGTKQLHSSSAALHPPLQVHLYTATLASRLTQQRLANDIKSKADLPGKPVETWLVSQGVVRGRSWVHSCGQFVAVGLR